MITATAAGLILLAFVVGVLLGRFERADRRIDHDPPLDVTPGLAQLRAWRSERHEHNPKLRVVKGGRR